MFEKIKAFFIEVRQLKKRALLLLLLLLIPFLVIPSVILLSPNPSPSSSSTPSSSSPTSSETSSQESSVSSSENEPVFTLTLEMNGGTWDNELFPSLILTNLGEGDYVQLPDTSYGSVEKDGFAFIGWYSDNTFLDAVVDASEESGIQYEMPASDVTLYLSWEEIVSSLNFDVFFATSTSYHDAGLFISGFESVDPITTLTIPDELLFEGEMTKVVGLADSLFLNNQTLTTIELPDTLQFIDSEAFFGAGITSIQLPSSLKGLGYAAFSESALTSIHLPENLVYVDEMVFEGSMISEVTFDLGFKLTYLAYGMFSNTPLSAINIPSSIVRIGEAAFEGSALASINFGENPRIQIMESSAFANTLLTTLVLPESLTEIGEYTFANTNITDLTFPASLATLWDDALSNMPALESLTFLEESNLRYIGAQNIDSSSPYFDNLITTFHASNQHFNFIIHTTLVYFHANPALAFDDLTIPEGVEVIADSVFEGTELGIVTFPSTMRYVRDSAFYDAQMHGINFNNGLLAIGEWVFEDVQLLSTQAQLVIPASVEFIGESAFNGMSSPTNELITVMDFSFTSLTELPYGLFRNNTVISEVKLPASLKIIFDNAFRYSSLSSINLPNQLEEIENDAFASTESLSTITILEDGHLHQLRLISRDAFEFSSYESQLNQNGYNVLGGVIFGTTLTTSTAVIASAVIGIASFAIEAETITSITFEGTSLEFIGRDAFNTNSGSLNIDSLLIPEGVTYIGKEAFTVPNLTQLSLPSTLTHVMPKAFDQLTNQGIFPNGQPTFEEVYATSFGNSTYATLVDQGGFTLTNGFIVINDTIYGFTEPTTGPVTTTATTPSNAKEIASDAFFQNQNLQSLTLNEGLTHIHDGAFTYSSLTSVSIPSTIQVIGEYAFSSSESLVTITFVGLQDLEQLRQNAFVRTPYINNLKSDGTLSNEMIIDQGILFDVRHDSTATSFVIPEGVVALYIGDQSWFYNQDKNNFEDIQLPSTLVTLTERVFTRFSQVRTLSMGDRTLDDLNYIGSSVFYRPLISHLTFASNKVLGFNPYAFEDMASLRSIQFPTDFPVADFLAYLPADFKLYNGVPLLLN